MGLFAQFSDNARRRREKRIDAVRQAESEKVLAEERERARQLLSEAELELEEGNYSRASTLAREGFVVEMGNLQYEANEFLRHNPPQR